MTLLVVTPPTAEPLTVTEAKLHLRVDGFDENFLIESIISAAREDAEAYTGRALMPQTLELRMDAFPAGDGEIEIPNIPVVSVASVKYIDGAGVLTTVTATDYVVINSTSPRGNSARIVLAFGFSWPVPRIETDAVRVQFTAGYADAAAVPFMIRAAMLLRIGDLYANREAQVIGGAGALTPNPTVDRLLDPFRVAWTA